MKIFILLLLILAAKPSLIGQATDSLDVYNSPERKTYNWTILDSCLCKIDASRQVVFLQFVNGSDEELKEAFINSFKSLEQIKYWIVDGEQSFRGEVEKLLGISIIIYCDDYCAFVETGEFTIDTSTREIIRMTRVEDNVYCWDFKGRNPIRNCEIRLK